jgi:tripartite-type tricarboxylate transporter receptor subunit TctC
MTKLLKTLVGVTSSLHWDVARASWRKTLIPPKRSSLIVPLGAGGATDVVARVVAGKLSQRLGQQVVVENRPGAEGIIGVNAGAKADPDGYTLVLGSSTTLAANFHLRKKLAVSSNQRSRAGVDGLKRFL